MLKDWLCQEPVVLHPDFGKKFILQTDASDVGLGVVLSQEVEREEHLVLYISRKLFPQEVAYLVIEKEGLAVKLAVNALTYCLLGNPFSLVTDHTPLL